MTKTHRGDTLILLSMANERPVTIKSLEEFYVYCRLMYETPPHIIAHILYNRIQRTRGYHCEALHKLRERAG